MSLLVMDSLYNEEGKWPVPINVWSGGRKRSRRGRVLRGKLFSKRKI